MNNYKSLELVGTLSNEIQVNTKKHNSKEIDSRIINGFEKNWRHFGLCLSLLYIIIKSYPNPYNWLGAFKYLVRLRKKFLGDFKLKKMAKVDGKYYMGLYTPGWSDTNYKRFIQSELNYYKPNACDTLRFNHVYVAITKKCALQCDHCYAWDILNQKDKLSEGDLRMIIDKLQELGTGQIHLTGGEPLLKTHLLIKLIEESKKNTNFWINTSGYSLTNEKAKNLKNAGLTGVFISLDHFDADKHNNFRKYKNAYYWATQGAKNAISNKIVVALSLCVTNEFISENNLKSYMMLAKDLGVQFVQFLEPKDVGHYSGKDVALNDENIKILESFYVKMNFSKDYLDFPIICYHGYYQRRQGCYAGGNRSMYVDTDGNMNACPFCHTNSGNILNDSFENQLELMSERGCPKY